MSILNDILKNTARIIRDDKLHTPLDTLKAQCAQMPIRPFRQTLRNAAHPAIIAEIKKASPSHGLIREDFAVPPLARDYRDGGAACLSVLTDREYFQGDIAFLRQAREAAPLPILRKDFIIDAYQIYQTRAMGGDCLLLIMAALDDAAAAEFYQLAKSSGLDVLVEIHNEQELQRALEFKPDIIGINNRNLDTLKVDLAVTERLSRDIPGDCLLVAESGLTTAQDIARMTRAGAGAFLIGESLMKQDNLTLSLQSLISDCRKTES